MSWSVRACVVGSLIAFGYVLGRSDVIQLPQVRAQDPSAGPSEETAKRIQEAYAALKVAMEALKQESRYTPATKSMNVYGILSGGLNAVEDLENGRGVDPETFAALYMNDATDEISQHLSRDEEGRLTYKNKVVRLYPVSRLQKQQAQRLVLTGEVKLPANAPQE